MRKRMYLLLIVLTGLGIISLAQADWVTKDGFIDYAQHAAGVPPQEQRTDGMPDFDQRQDGWFNGQNQWNWCGPVAAGNCLWWFDSKFEMIKCISLPPGSQVRPPAVSDHYSLKQTNRARLQRDPEDGSYQVKHTTMIRTVGELGGKATSAPL